MKLIFGISVLNVEQNFAINNQMTLTIVALPGSWYFLYFSLKYYQCLSVIEMGPI